MFPEEQNPCFLPAGIRGYTSHGPRTHANVGGPRLNSPSWCSKCNRKHNGGSCSGRTNHCFHCKETGHVKRYCPTSWQNMNAMGTGRPQAIGRVVTMCGAETSLSDSLTRCGMYEEKVNESQRSYALTGVRRNHGYQGSKPTVPTEGVSTPMCNQCGRPHYGSTCQGKGNGCFNCKEFGHIKRYCPKLDRRPNVMHAEEARAHGRMVTPSGARTLGVDDPARVGFNPGNGLARFDIDVPCTSLYTCHACTDFELCDSCIDEFLNIVVDSPVTHYCTNPNDAGIRQQSDLFVQVQAATKPRFATFFPSVLQAPDWRPPFDLECDIAVYALGIVLASYEFDFLPP
ncbi:hypothetical protein Lal_00027103 [Lupinus albus]|nr:hypothetical protein Lal_00027103 [Lupinus albus]